MSTYLGQGNAELTRAGGPELQLLLMAGRLVLGTAQDTEALALLRRPLHWPRLYAQADAEGMSGLLASQLLRLARVYDLALPLEPLTQALHGIFTHNGAMFAALATLRQALRQRGLQAILLKGGALIETVYGGQAGLRPLSDLDLLIKAADFGAVVEVLRQQDFRPLSPASAFFMDGSAAIDLHTEISGAARLRRRALAFRFDAEALWREAVPLDPHDATLLTLAPTHQFLHLAVHGLKHSFARLFWFVDMGLVLPCVAWEELLSWAEDSGALRALAYALGGLQALMGIEIPTAVLTRLPRLNRLERAFLRRVVRRQEMQTLGEVMVAFSVPGVMDKLRYLLEFGFPRHEVLADVFPTTPTWLRYPRRLLQGVTLGIGAGRGFGRSLR